MSRGGGRGGGRGGSYIVQAYKSLLREGPLSQRQDEGELYPALPGRPAAPTVGKRMQYMIDVKRQLESRCLAGEPQLRHLPPELNWRRRPRRRPAALDAVDSAGGAGKRQKVSPQTAPDAASSAPAAAADEERPEPDAVATERRADASDAGDSDEDVEEHFENDEELEDNDYMETYFDNGEGYGGDDGDGEDMDGESWFY